ncbi:hypothetical protein CDD83_3013 [Cordyceps sp. RAO-2017]|nr:hypothetical protein CDD83_3013 [Cordyceps sp. RAO-2017]
MGVRAVSPGEALLRNSRMFSMPKPLPDPYSTSYNVGEHRSPTTTKPYPQQQSIATPFSSRERGDWGLKRPFPFKSTMTTSTPLIRVNHVDSRESVTDFASAAAYTMSLEKFQELRLPLYTRRNKEFQTKAKEQSASSQEFKLFSRSVFEDFLDFTELPRAGDANNRRWRFKGPWLARMTPGDFNTYLENQVRPRRAQFKALLKSMLARKITEDRNKAAADKGLPPPPPVQAGKITQDEFTEYLRRLRNDRPTLYTMISDFLDMAPLGRPNISIYGKLSGTNQDPNDGPYAKSGPPRCHPSAGISYLRTDSFMENHPVYGPQAKKTPVMARILVPKVSQAVGAKLGVGGFVAEAPGDYTRFNVSHQRKAKGLTVFDTQTYGGAKMLVHPASANIDPSGKVVMELKEAKEEAQLVYKESKGLLHPPIYNDGDGMAQALDPTAAMQSPAGDQSLGGLGIDGAAVPSPGSEQVQGGAETQGVDQMGEYDQVQDGSPSSSAQQSRGRW